MLIGFAALLLAEGTGERNYGLYAVMLCAIVLMTIAVRRRQREGFGKAAARQRGRLEDLAGQRGVRDDMEQLLGELQELSRRINAQIDTKYAKLEAAIADADRRIEAMERLTRMASGRPGVDVTIADESPAHGEVEAEPPTPADAAAGRYAAVYELADAGKNPVEIARTLGRTPGEVELILSLRRTT